MYYPLYTAFGAVRTVGPSPLGIGRPSLGGIAGWYRQSTAFVGVDMAAPGYLECLIFDHSHLPCLVLGHSYPACLISDHTRRRRWDQEMVSGQHRHIHKLRSDRERVFGQYRRSHTRPVQVKLPSGEHQSRQHLLESADQVPYHKPLVFHAVQGHHMVSGFVTADILGPFGLHNNQRCCNLVAAEVLVLAYHPRHSLGLNSPAIPARNRRHYKNRNSAHLKRMGLRWHYQPPYNHLARLVLLEFRKDF